MRLPKCDFSLKLTTIAPGISRHRDNMEARNKQACSQSAPLLTVNL